MTILVTGANGQLGKETILALEADGVRCVAVGRDEVDFSRPEKVAGAIADYAADWVINCAAYTKVDEAEEERELAFTVNSDAARAVAEGVKRSGGRLLQLSTDFIFSGEQSHPYEEDDVGCSAGCLWEKQTGRRAGCQGSDAGGRNPQNGVGVWCARAQFRQDHSAPGRGAARSSGGRRPGRYAFLDS